MPIQSILYADQPQESSIDRYIVETNEFLSNHLLIPVFLDYLAVGLNKWD